MRIRVAGRLATSLVIGAGLSVGVAGAHAQARDSACLASVRGMAMAMRSGHMPKGMELPGRLSCVGYRPALTPSGWTVRATSSAPGRPASGVLRGRGFWQSRPLDRAGRLPQTITIVLHRSLELSGLRYAPERGVGQIAGFTVSLSRDGRRFGPAVARGRWQNNRTTKQVYWAPTTARAVRIEITSVSPASARSVAVARFVLSGVNSSQSPVKPPSPTPVRPPSPTPISPPTQPPISPPVPRTGAALYGQWGSTIGFPVDPVAVALVPGNKLVMWAADGSESFDSTDAKPITQSAVYDLTTGAITPATITVTGHDMFCSGVSILPNGDLLVTGGIGDKDTSIYDWASGTWSAGPQMNIGRGYQGQTTLSNGEAFTLGGSWSGGLGGKLGEVYDPSSGWRELSGVPATPIDTNDADGVYRADNHGWFVAVSGGNVFHAGPSEEMHWITTSGAGTITDAGARGSSGDEMNGNAVLYDVDKILTVGGAPDYEDSNATTASNVIDISGGLGSTPTVTATSPLNIPRSYANSVVLPDGSVFTVGGQTYPVAFADTTSVLTPELWSPSTGRWTEMAPQAEPRNYHSVAVLLPDGRVFSGGGGLCGVCSTNHPDAQIWSPPYLFNANGTPATRPTITSAPSSASNGQTITVTTDSPVSSFALVRYGESTHSVDNDQRRIPLAIQSSSGNTYTLTIPSDPGVALAGPYMLFALNSAGTPSVASTVMISNPTLVAGSGL